MKTQSPDTSPDAERVLIELARKMPPERKLQLAGQLGASMRNLMRAGLRQRHPDASPEELERLFQPFYHNRFGIQGDRQAVAIRAPALAFDGNPGTRWSSAFADPQWIQVDLGSSVPISRVVLQWEGAYGRAYQIQTSPDGTAWTTIHSTTTGAGGTETLTVNGTGRYVRMNGTAFDIAGTGKANPSSLAAALRLAARMAATPPH